MRSLLFLLTIVKSQRPPRSFSFLGVNRKRLAKIALIFPVFMMSFPVVPAEAGIVHSEARAAELQMFKASSAVLQVEPVRENYSITQLAVVRYPTAMRSISSGFGYRRSPCWGCSSYHEGVDITPGSGTPVVAIARGTVVDAGWSGGYGVYVEIQHVINGATVTSFYGHMQSGSLAVGVGARVAMGQRIGRVGNTGSSTGAHLHFEIRVGGGRAVEPLGWIRQHRN